MLATVAILRLLALPIRKQCVQSRVRNACEPTIVICAWDLIGALMSQQTYQRVGLAIDNINNDSSWGGNCVFVTWLCTCRERKIKKLQESLSIQTEKN